MTKKIIKLDENDYNEKFALYLFLVKINELIDAWNNQSEECQHLHLYRKKGDGFVKDECKDCGWTIELNNWDSLEGQTKYCLRCERDSRHQFIGAGPEHTCGLKEKEEKCDEENCYCPLDCIKDQPSKPGIRETVEEKIYKGIYKEKITTSEVADQILDLARKEILEKANKKKISFFGQLDYLRSEDLEEILNNL